MPSTIFCAYSSQGGRSHNEDTAFACSDRVMVADGIGSYGAGDKASKAAVDFYTNKALLPCSGVVAAVTQGATTFTGVQLVGRAWAFLHCGDTAAFLYNAAGLRRLTEDQSVFGAVGASNYSDAFDIREAKRTLLSYLGGGRDASLTWQSGSVPAAPGDIIVVLSDGFYGCCEDPATGLLDLGALKPIIDSVLLASPEEAQRICMDCGVRKRDNASFAALQIL